MTKAKEKLMWKPLLRPIIQGFFAWVFISLNDWSEELRIGNANYIKFSLVMTFGFLIPIAITVFLF